MWHTHTLSVTARDYSSVSQVSVCVCVREVMALTEMCAVAQMASKQA